MTPRAIPRLLKLPEVQDLVGGSTSTIYDLVTDNVFPPAVKLGRSARWPEDEIGAWVDARVKGATRDQLRQLVKDLVATRQTRGPSTFAPAPRQLPTPRKRKQRSEGATA